MYKTVGIRKPKDFSKTYHFSQNPKINFEKSITDKELDVLCINCMKMVKTTLAPEHSLTCTEVHSEVKLIDQCSLMQQADYKIRRLAESLTQLYKDPYIQSDKDKYALQMLDEYSKDILKITEYTKIDVLKCREVIFNAVMLIKNFKGSPRMTIQMERFLVLIKEKYGQLISYYKEIKSSSAIELKSQKELRRTLDEKLEKLSETLHSVAKVRTTLLTNKNLETYNPLQIKDMNQGSAEMNSELGASE